MSMEQIDWPQPRRTTLVSSLRPPVLNETATTTTTTSTTTATTTTTTTTPSSTTSAVSPTPSPTNATMSTNSTQRFLCYPFTQAVYFDRSRGLAAALAAGLLATMYITDALSLAIFYVALAIERGSRCVCCLFGCIPCAILCPSRLIRFTRRKCSPVCQVTDVILLVVMLALTVLAIINYYSFDTSVSFAEEQLVTELYENCTVTFGESTTNSSEDVGTAFAFFGSPLASSLDDVTTGFSFDFDFTQLDVGDPEDARRRLDAEFQDVQLQVAEKGRCFAANKTDSEIVRCADPQAMIVFRRSPRGDQEFAELVRSGLASAEFPGTLVLGLALVSVALRASLSRGRFASEAVDAKKVDEEADEEEKEEQRDNGDGDGDGDGGGDADASAHEKSSIELTQLPNE